MTFYEYFHISHRIPSHYVVNNVVVTSIVAIHTRIHTHHWMSCFNWIDICSFELNEKREKCSVEGRKGAKIKFFHTNSFWATLTTTMSFKFQYYVRLIWCFLSLSSSLIYLYSLWITVGCRNIARKEQFPFHS